MVLSSIVNSIIKDETLSVEFNISSDDLKLIIKHDRLFIRNKQIGDLKKLQRFSN